MKLADLSRGVVIGGKFRLIDVLGRGGGYVLGPSHAIQAGTPPENIAALFDTAATHRRHA